MLKNTISSDINLNSVYVYFLQLFQECVSDWCLQDNTTEQYTKCRSASEDGTICFNPEIRYGSTIGGFPTNDAQNNNLEWCKQLFPDSTQTDATYSNSKSLNVGTGALKWCSEGDEPNFPKWCDAADSNWKDSTLDMLLSTSCKEDTGLGCIMTSVTCKSDTTPSPKPKSKQEQPAYVDGLDEEQQGRTGAVIKTG